MDIFACAITHFLQWMGALTVCRLRSFVLFTWTRATDGGRTDRRMALERSPADSVPCTYSHSPFDSVTY